MEHQRIGSGPHTVLVLHGWFGSSRARRALPTEILSNAGHYAMEETPVALAGSVERFLARW